MKRSNPSNRIARNGSKKRQNPQGRKQASPQGKAGGDTVTIRIQDHTGKKFCDVEFPRPLYDIIIRECDRRRWTLDEFFDSAIRNTLEREGIIMRGSAAIQMRGSAAIQKKARAA
jgi:hypothetical protein